MTRTASDIVADCNALADRFAALFGHISRPDFKYYEATHPQEVLLWNLAVEAYDHIEGTPVEDCLMEMEDEQ